MNRYLRETSGKKSHDRDLDCAVHLGEHFGGKMVNEITPEDITAYKIARAQDTAFPNLQLQDRTVKPATIAKELWLLSAAIKHANKEWGWKLENPVKGRVPVADPSAPKWLTAEEVGRLIAAVRRSPHLLDFIELGLNTGMRCEEMLALDWRRVDFDGRLVWFDSVDQKSGVPGSIPLNGTAAAVLRRRQDFRRVHCPTSPWVFCTADGERLEWIKATFRRAAERAGLKASPHSLRHTFASRLVQAGVPLRTVKDLCRHADIRTTMRYAFLSPDNTRSAIDILDSIHGAKAGDVPGKDK